MAKKMKKFMSMMLVLCMMASMLSVGAFAADGTVVENESTTVDGVTTDVTTTTTTTTDENGNVTVNLKIESTTAGTDSEGVTINGQETYEQTTVTDANGKQIANDYVLDGSETKEWVEEDSGDAAGQPVVEAPVVPGETTVATGGVTSETVTNADGSVTTTTTTDRTVITETTDVKVTVNETESGLVGEQETELNGRAPVYDYIDGVKQDKGGMFDNQFNSGLTSKYAKNPENWDMPEEADVRFVGTGEHTVYYSATVYVVYEKDAEGNTVYDDEGNAVIKELYRYDPKTYTPQLITKDGEPVTELPEGIDGLAEYDINPGANRPTLHALMDQNGNVVYGYCIDNMVDTSTGDWYKIINLEDSDYYASEDAENHVRNIVLNGYWGTTNIAKEDGTYEEGSVESIKAKILDAVKAGKLESEVKVYEYDTNGLMVRDENGEPKYTVVAVEDVIAGLTAGEAHIATQAAIWSYSNGSIAAQNGKDGYLTIDPDFRNNHKAGNSKPNADILDGMGGARLDIMYTWLIGLENEEESTVVINEKNFVEDVSLSIGDKVSDAKENQDDNNDNDVYNSALNFKLAFVPGENDDLLVQITYTDLDGNDVTVIRRLAGENAEGQSYEDIKPEADGSYVLKGLKLSENKDFAFDLRLEGTQYLEDGVYVYESLRGREVAQNFVGVAQGTRNVDVSIGVTVKFDVDENNHVVAERTWHDEADPEEAPVPFNFGHVVPRPLDNIPDEEVPLADAPQTGDEAAIFAILTVLAGISLMAMHVSEQKRKEEA